MSHFFVVLAEDLSSALSSRVSVCSSRGVHKAGVNCSMEVFIRITSLCNCSKWYLQYIVILQKTDDGSLGLSSQEAFKRLFDVINDELTTFTAANCCTWRRDLRSALSVNHHLPISFISLTFLVFEFLVMVMSYAFTDATRK